MRHLTNSLVILTAMIALAPVGASAQDDPHGVAYRVTQLEAEVAALYAQVESMEVALARVQEVLQFVRVETEPINELAGPHWIIEGANVHVHSGSGRTDDGCPGDDSNCPLLRKLGNLVVGYNEGRVFAPGGTIERTGSHNLVVGPGHSYTSFGGFVSGTDNTVSERASSVSGGLKNVASGSHSSISGGVGNVASATLSSVSGGTANVASGFHSWVGGGSSNEASSVDSSVGGGFLNKASHGASSVFGGRENSASGELSAVVGGQTNEASGPGSTVCGGFANAASGILSSVSGGIDNEAAGAVSSVSGGSSRTAPADSNWAAGSLLEPN